ncbi:MAG: N-acetyltransferase [Acidobacteriaceae bacterium]
MALPDESPIAIRPAVLQDLDRLVEIDAECFPAGIAYPREEIAALLVAPSVLTVVAEKAGAIAGFAALGWSRRRGARYGELITIDILPQFRREGVGWQLHEELERWLRAGDGASIHLHVSIANTAAINFYQRLGYRTTARIPRYYLGRIDAWRMEKALF